MSLDLQLSHERMLDREDRRDDPSLWSSISRHGMIATAHYLATKAGAEVLAAGGNAVDAAVTASLALAVCEPASSGLGGMALGLIHMAEENRTFVIEGPCRAPASATPDRLSTPRLYRGYQSVAVPGYIATLEHALRSYGTLSAGAALQPAIRLAEEGFPVSRLYARLVTRSQRPLSRETAADFFLDAQHNPPSLGQVFRQPVLAATLRRLEQGGFDDFYRGGIAREIAADMRVRGGFVDLADLEAVAVREVPSISIDVGDDTFHCIGPPGGGVALLQMLGVAAQLSVPVDPDTPEGAVLCAAVIRQARRHRQALRLTTGPDELGAAAEVLTEQYARSAASDLVAELSGSPVPTPSSARALAAGGGGDTSHLSVMDAQGNVVALTQSIERTFGAAVATPGLGFLYNGYLKTFKVENEKHPFYLRPGRPARSNAAPTIGFRDGRPWVAIGSTGSERMSSGILQTLLRLKKQEPFAAVHAPRLHATPHSVVLLEADRFSPQIQDALVRRGFSLRALAPYSWKVGGLQLVIRRGGTLCGVGEPRRDGAAAGPP